MTVSSHPGCVEEPSYVTYSALSGSIPRTDKRRTRSRSPGGETMHLHITRMDGAGGRGGGGRSVGGRRGGGGSGGCGVGCCGVCTPHQVSYVVSMLLATVRPIR